MKPRLIIGIFFIIGFTSLLMYNFSGSIGSYVTFEQAEDRSGMSYIIGIWDSDKPHGFDIESRTFQFHMIDESGVSRRVIYNKVKPANFEEADQLVVKGFMRNGVFHSDDMLVKCPSKYNDANTAELTTEVAS